MQLLAQVNEHKVVDSLNLKALKIYASNTNEAMKLLAKAEKISRNKKLNLSLAYTLDNMGIVTRVKGDYEKGIDFSEKALALTKDSTIVASAYNNIGSCKRNLGLYEEALKAYLKSIKIYDKKKDLNNQAIINNNIGLVYRSLEMNNKAKSYHRKAIFAFEKLKKKKGLSEAYNNMAIIYAYEDSLSSALKYFKYSLKLEEELKDIRGIAESLNNVGGVYYYMEEIDSALNYFSKAIKLERSAKNYASLASAYNNLGDVYLYKQNFVEAKKNFDSAFVYAKKSKSAFDIENTLNYYALLYEAKNDYKKASEFYKKKGVFHDSIQKLSNVKQLQELETKYQTAKKDTEIAKNRADLAEKELKLKKKNTIIFGSLGFAFVLGLLGYLLYNQQKIKNNQLIKEAELKEALVKIETQNKLQEQRLQISRDLHDNIGSQLTFIISTIDNLKYGLKNQDEKIINKLTSLSGFTKETIAELRDTIWAMNKDEISFEDLKIRISNFIENAQIASSGIDFEFNCKDEFAPVSLSSVEGINSYRIIQESINNALKHAKATKVSVEVLCQNQFIEIIIKDNGIGFNEATTNLGNGLSNLKKRAKELNGEILVTSQLNEGTTVVLKFNKK